MNLTWVKKTKTKNIANHFVEWVFFGGDKEREAKQKWAIHFWTTENVRIQTVAKPLGPKMPHHPNLPTNFKMTCSSFQTRYISHDFPN